jgi:hypothetical protein
MGERDQVWEHGENLFPGFKCKYCVKKNRGGGNDEDDTGGGTASLTAQGEGHERPTSPFTIDQFTHCT